MGLSSPLTLAAIILLSLSAPIGHAYQESSETQALERFQDAVDEFVWLRHRLERSLPALRVTSDPQEIRRAVEARADAIRAARPHARSGDIFGDAADVFCLRMQTALRSRAYKVEKFLAEINEGARRPTAFPKVHDSFRWCRAAVMPPWILDVLPPLPEGLQYRLIERELVLVDLDADLVIDILPAALAS